MLAKANYNCFMQAYLIQMKELAFAISVITNRGALLCLVFTIFSINILSSQINYTSFG